MLAQRSLSSFKSLRKNTSFQFLLILVFLITIAFTMRIINERQNLQQDAEEIDGAGVVYTYTEQVDNGDLPPTTKIFEILLTYNATASPILTIDAITQKNGYVPELPILENPYKLQLLNTQNQVTYETPFELPTDHFDIPPEPGTENQPTQIQPRITVGSLAVTVPSIDQSVNVRILSPSGSLITQKSLVGVPQINNIPSFETRYGDDIQTESEEMTPEPEPTTKSSDSQPNFVAKLKSFLPSFSLTPQVFANNNNKKNNGNNNNNRNNNKGNNNKGNNNNNNNNNNNKKNPPKRAPKQCNKKADCKHRNNTPYCSRGGRCVECNTSQQCKNNLVCSNNSCVSREKAKKEQRNQNGYLDIAVIGDKYTRAEMPLFHQHVDQAVAHLLTYEPFKTRAAQIRIHYINNLQPLGCHSDPRIIRVPICNPDHSKNYSDVGRIIGLVNNAAVPYDEIMVFWNTSEYRGATSYNMNVATTAGANQWTREIFVHELAHIFARLEDEYIVDNGSSLSEANCSRTKPNPAWNGIVDSDNYFLGCTKPNWYRSSAESIMLNLYEKYFNRVSQMKLNAAFDRVTGTPIPLVPSTPSEPLTISCEQGSWTITTPYQTGTITAKLQTPVGTLVPGGVITWKSSSDRITFTPASGSTITNNSGEASIQVTFTNPQTTAMAMDTITAQLGDGSEVTTTSSQCQSYIYFPPLSSDSISRQTPTPSPLKLP